MKARCFERHAACLIVAVATAAPAWAAAPAPATTPPAQAKPAAAPATRDLGGIWVIPGIGRNEDGTQRGTQGRGTQADSNWSPDPLPFTVAGRKAFDANKPLGGPRQVKSELSNDPRDKANPVGLYRMIQTSGNGRSFEIDQHGDQIVQMFSYGRIWRVIHTDNRPVEENSVGPFWYGNSFGKWEGDTLVVTTIDLDPRAWLDGWGTPLSQDARVTERWKRVAPDRIEFSFTVNDPQYYSRPWSSRTVTFVAQKKGIEPIEMITAPADIEEYTDTLLIPSSKPKAPAPR